MSLFPSRAKLKRELLEAAVEFSNRGLKRSSLWCGEQGSSIELENDNLEMSSMNFFSDIPQFALGAYIFAKTLFDNKEYRRAAFQLEKFVTTCSKCSFLHSFSLFLDGETRLIENMTDPVVNNAVNPNGKEHLKNLLIDLKKSEQLDGYHSYLMGVIMKKLGRLKEAKQQLTSSVNQTPMLHASWFELKTLINCKDDLNSLQLPQHWMRDAFMAEVNSNFQLNAEVVKKLEPVFDAGFEKSPYFFTCLAKAHHNLRDLDSSIECFEEMRQMDPYRIEDLDVLSNDYYVKGKRVELSVLAHEMVDLAKYRHETCCVVGNYYSLREEHEKAIIYFQRALKLNPNYISAWTLMGHELIELKNTSGAVQAYRRAIEIDPKDFRAWYGLGQTYEILKMHLYAIYYFQEAHVLRPNDSRFLVALGSCYESCNKVLEAEKCYWKAYSVGDCEGTALLKLGRIFERQDSDKEKEEKAVAIYQRYIEEAEVEGTVDTQEQGSVYLYLAKFYIRKEDLLEKANEMATKALQYRNTKEAARALLKEVTEKRKEYAETNELLNTHGMLVDPDRHSF